MEVNVTLQNYNTEVVGTTGYVLVDFWASWCGPCMALAPTIAEIASEYAGRVKVCKVNVDEAPELAQMFNVSSIPTLILFKNGQPVKQSVGFVPKTAIVSMWAGTGRLPDRATARN